jgi:hypothetical protein
MAKLTINVSVVFMARYVMVLRGATSLRGALEGVGPENRDFFWALKWHKRSECHLGPKKSILGGGKLKVCLQGEVLVRNVIHYVPVLLPKHHL